MKQKLWKITGNGANMGAKIYKKTVKNEVQQIKKCSLKRALLQNLPVLAKGEPSRREPSEENQPKEENLLRKGTFWKGTCKVSARAGSQCKHARGPTARSGSQLPEGNMPAPGLGKEGCERKFPCRWRCARQSVSASRTRVARKA